MPALIDGNNFYVSYERVFQPWLQGRPVVVLSNNDGCAIARSDEAKTVGIKMGAPYFQVRELARDAGLIALSANFALYGDMSDRMMILAADLSHMQEVNSIDENFIDLSNISFVALRAEMMRMLIKDGHRREDNQKTNLVIVPSRRNVWALLGLSLFCGRELSRVPACLGKTSFCDSDKFVSKARDDFKCFLKCI
jgi:nucleotidyltransferase/DNA polymerase involved in DNA repair